MTCDDATARCEELVRQYENGLARGREWAKAAPPTVATELADAKGPNFSGDNPDAPEYWLEWARERGERFVAMADHIANYSTVLDVRQTFASGFTSGVRRELHRRRERDAKPTRTSGPSRDTAIPF